MASHKNKVPNMTAWAARDCCGTPIS